MEPFSNKLNAAARIDDPHARLDAYRDLVREYRVTMAWWSLAVELAHQCRDLYRAGDTWEAAHLRVEAHEAVETTRRLDRNAGTQLARIVEPDLAVRHRLAA